MSIWTKVSAVGKNEILGVFLTQNRCFIVKNIQNDPYLTSICVEYKRFEFEVKEKLKKVSTREKVNTEK